MQPTVVKSISGNFSTKKNRVNYWNIEKKSSSLQNQRLLDIR